MSEQISLKPCPFCGSKDVDVAEEGEGYSWQNTFQVSCYNSECKSYATTRAGAIELWNRRAIESAVLASSPNALEDSTERSLGSGAAASAITERDAARYRWLRENSQAVHRIHWKAQPEALGMGDYCEYTEHECEVSTSSTAAWAFDNAVDAGRGALVLVSHDAAVHQQTSEQSETNQSASFIQGDEDLSRAGGKAVQRPDGDTERDEFDVVREMLSAAAKYGLQVEVVTYYGKFRANGDAPEQAAACALYEWDL